MAGGPLGSFHPKVITRSEVAAAEAFDAAHPLEGIWEMPKKQVYLGIQCCHLGRLMIDESGRPGVGSGQVNGLRRIRDDLLEIVRRGQTAARDTRVKVEL
jgi:hypothetical protein